MSAASISAILLFPMSQSLSGNPAIGLPGILALSLSCRPGPSRKASVAKCSSSVMVRMMALSVTRLAGEWNFEPALIGLTMHPECWILYSLYMRDGNADEIQAAKLSIQSSGERLALQRRNIPKFVLDENWMRVLD